MDHAGKDDIIAAVQQRRPLADVFLMDCGHRDAVRMARVHISADMHLRGKAPLAALLVGRFSGSRLPPLPWIGVIVPQVAG